MELFRLRNTLKAGFLKRFGWLITLRMKGPGAFVCLSVGSFPCRFSVSDSDCFCSLFFFFFLLSPPLSLSLSPFQQARRGRQAGRQRRLKVQSDPSAGLMLCSDISSSTISLLFDVGDARRGGLSFHAVKSSVRERRQEWNFNDPHAFRLIKTEYIKPNHADKIQ